MNRAGRATVRRSRFKGLAPADRMEADMNRDELIRELRMHSASWQAVVILYGIIVGTMVVSAMAIL
jgi:hypothetical protein